MSNLEFKKDDISITIFRKANKSNPIASKKTFSVYGFDLMAASFLKYYHEGYINTCDKIKLEYICQTKEDYESPPKNMNNIMAQYWNERQEIYDYLEQEKINTIDHTRKY